MTKCPWCGFEMLAFVFSKGWSARCTNKSCPAVQYHATPDKALAAASKRFTPKRTVEEIEAFCEKLDVEKQKQWRLCVRDNNISMEFMEFLRMMQFHRIADYIYGAE